MISLINFLRSGIYVKMDCSVKYSQSQADRKLSNYRILRKADGSKFVGLPMQRVKSEEGFEC